jgi:hypothetical protein
MGTLKMTVPTPNYYALPVADTIVGGVSASGGENPWAKRTLPRLEDPGGTAFGDAEEDWLRTVLQEIGAIAALEEDWDGYGSGPIRTDVLWYALGLLQTVMDDFPAPQLTPMSHEGILLEWHRDGVRLEIEIENAGEAYVSYENEETGIDDSWPVRADFTSLQEPLRAIAGQTLAPSIS